MGIVYRAEDLRLGRAVALKLVAPGAAANRRARERLEREARAAASLEHPAICPLFDVGETEAGDLYLVLPCFEGESLRDRLAAGPLPVARALEVAAEVADGLAAAHAAGVVHRDVKPSNLFLTRDGRLKILDFGVARFGDDAGLTRDGAVVGTPAYMAPEQARGEAVDGRADLWSLGVTLYEAVCGATPFGGDHALAVLRAVGEEPPARLPLEGAARDAVEPILARALAKDPALRFGSGAEMAAALRAARSRLAEIGEAPAARPLAPRTDVPLAPTASLPAGKTPARPPTVVVLPLRPLGVEEYLADGLTEILIHELARLRSLRVISRTTAMRYRTSAKRPPEIARELGADAVVEGSALASASGVRLILRVVDAASDELLGSHLAECAADDLLAAAARAARSIARDVDSSAPGTAFAHGAIDVRASEAYLRARHHFNQLSVASLERAFAELESALELEPELAIAHAALAEAFNLRGFFGLEPPLAVYPRARAAARRALELDPTLAEAHRAMGWVELGLDWNWSAAERSFARALEAGPSDAEAHLGIGYCRIVAGDLAGAEPPMARARELDPLSLRTGSGEVFLAYLARRYDRAVAGGRELLALQPGYSWAHRFVSAALWQLGDRDASVSESIQAYALEGRPDVAAALESEWRRGDAEAAMRAAARALETRPPGEHVPSADVAFLLLRAGDHEEALDWLERARGERDSFLLYLHLLPRCDPLRANPRFRALVARIGLPTRARAPGLN